MTGVPIVESGMSFGPFAAESCFEIEKSASLAKLGSGVKITEMVLLKAGRIWVIEAKSSSPKPSTEPRFAEFVAEIREKLQNAVLLTLALRMGRHGEEGAQDLPSELSLVPLTAEVLLLLVIRGHRGAWLPPLQEKLNQELSVLLRCLGRASVVVINDEKARDRGLIR